MSEVTIIRIDPVAKPRMTQRDKWKKRPAVTRYRAFCDELRRQVSRGFRFPECGYHMKFVIPMPESWSKRKRAEMDGKPHQQTPDKDNLEKAVLDALLVQDCRVWDGRVTKRWGETGMIVIEVEAGDGK